MAITIDPFVPSTTILGTDKIQDTDDKIRTIMDESATYLENQSQSAADQLEVAQQSIEIAAQQSADDSAASAANAATSEINAAASETNAANSAASVDANNIIHKIGSGLSNEGYTKAEADATLAQIQGDATKTFKVSDAINADEALAFGQLTGYVLPFATSIVPSGYLECNGSALSRTAYADLFAVLGTTYGVGDGSTTFNIPDLRGEFIRGYDNGRGIDNGRVIGTWQVDELKSHKHNYIGSRHVYGGYGNPGNAAVEGTSIIGSTDSVGGTETRPRNIAMMYCIKY